ncbi:hypothetical protein STEG23_034603 [Scotinomys teguina]
MSAVMLLPGTNGSLLLVQRTVTRTIVLQETIGKDECSFRSSPEKVLFATNEDHYRKPLLTKMETIDYAVSIPD